jgi:uncharacterized protein (UPF0335 family)
MNDRVDHAELRQFIERIEAQDERIADEKEAGKEIYAELKSRGYDAKVMRKLIALRKRNKDDVAEEDAVLQMYMEAVGL